VRETRLCAGDVVDALLRTEDRGRTRGTEQRSGHIGEHDDAAGRRLSQRSGVDVGDRRQPAGAVGHRGSGAVDEPGTERREHTDAEIGGRARSDAEDEALHTVLERGGDRLAEPARRRVPGTQPAAEQFDPARRRELDDRGTVRQQQPCGVNGRSRGPGDRERHQRPLSPVGHRPQHHVVGRSHRPPPVAQCGGGRGSGDRALEAVGGEHDAGHGRDATRSPARGIGHRLASGRMDT